MAGPQKAINLGDVSGVGPQSSDVVKFLVPAATLRDGIGPSEALGGDAGNTPLDLSAAAVGPWGCLRVSYLGSLDGWTTALGGSCSLPGLYVQNTLVIYFSFLTLILYEKQINHSIGKAKYTVEFPIASFPKSDHLDTLYHIFRGMTYR